MSIKLHVRQDIGEGDPIVLIHGIFGDGTQWNEISKLLAKKQRVIVIDVLGHGNSPKPKNAKYTASEHSSSLRNTLVTIGATENLTLVGYSMGGAVALSYCADYPDDIDQLYLISTPFYLKPEQMISMNYVNSLLFTKISLGLFKFLDTRLVKGKRVEKIVSYANDSAYFHKMIGANDNKIDSEIARLNLKGMIWDFDFVGKLSKIKSPTTIYAGKKDLFIVQGQLYALKQIQPYADIERLDIIKIDHMIVQNLPKQTAELITKNLDLTLNVGFDSGSGRTIVLLHGIESSSSYWSHIAPLLSENNRVVCLDLLGFGQSPKPSNIPYSLDDQVKAVHKTLEKMEIFNFELVGHSLGSLVSLAYGSKYSKNVASLTLLSPVIISDSISSKKNILKRLNLIDNISDTSYMLNQTSKAIGEKRIKKYLPFVRSVKNSVRGQKPEILASELVNIPTKFIYGENDPLVDILFIEDLASKLKHSEIIKIPSAYHNFPMSSPEVVLSALDGDKNYSKKIKHSDKLPPTFLKQILKLSAPILILKSIVNLTMGILLFTDYAAYALSIGLVLTIFYQSSKIIKGAFSLRNEGLSYIGYLLMAIGVFMVGFGLFKYPETSLNITVLLICLFVLLSGIARFIVSILWTKSKKLKKKLMLTGSALILVGTSALLGNIKSVYFIVYFIAVILILRAVFYSTFVFGSLIMAYIRGFNKE